jgi:ribosomal RNA assembly protein
MVEAKTRVRIPRERLGVLIGPNGITKLHIEKALNVNMTVNSEDGNVELALKPDSQDPTQIFRAKNVVTAISRGFSPNSALRLLDEETNIDIIDLRDIFKSQSDIQRVKGRIIGRGGKTRRIIEELTDVDVRVYGNTVSLIGSIGFEVAKEAVQMLIEGRQHKTVYRFLHRKKRKLKEEEIKIWKPTPKEMLEE